MFESNQIQRKRGDDMPRKSHRRRRKKNGQVAENRIEPYRIARPMWRVSAKLGQAWSIAYEGSDPKKAMRANDEYKEKGYPTTIERI